MTEERDKGGRPPIIDTPEEFTELFEAYVQECEDEKRPLTVAGAAYFLGFESRQSFYAYGKKDAFSYTVRKARLLLERAHEESLHKGGGQVAGPIFWMKNNAGYSDKQHLEHSGGETPIAIDITRRVIDVNDDS